MVRFGKIYPLSEKLTLFGKLNYYIFGNPNIGGFIRSQYFKRFIRQVNWEYALDAGCGCGEFSFYLAEKFPLRKIDAFDKKDMAKNIELAKKLNLRNLNFFNFDLSKVDFTEKYDIICLIGTLIYFSAEENQEILKKLFNALKPGGFIFFDVPQKNGFDKGLINKKYYQRKLDEHTKKNLSGHLYSSQEIRILFESIGFKNIKVRKTFGFFGRLAWELDLIMQQNKLYRLKAISLLFLKMFCILDAQIHNKNGGCLLVTARK